MCRIFKLPRIGSDLNTYIHVYTRTRAHTLPKCTKRFLYNVVYKCI